MNNDNIESDSGESVVEDVSLDLKNHLKFSNFNLEPLQKDNVSFVTTSQDLVEDFRTLTIGNKGGNNLDSPVSYYYRKNKTDENEHKTVGTPVKCEVIQLQKCTFSCVSGLYIYTCVCV